MYYKVLKNNDIVDILNHIVYVKYQKKHNILLICDKKEAQAILSSDGMKAWHIEGLYNYPMDDNIYELIKISEEEYNELNELNKK